ncbi:hypothetical protein F5B18DRAFT_635360, partial [Nemania serpens]
MVFYRLREVLMLLKHFILFQYANAFDSLPSIHLLFPMNKHMVSKSLLFTYLSCKCNLLTTSSMCYCYDTFHPIDLYVVWWALMTRLNTGGGCLCRPVPHPPLYFTSALQSYLVFKHSSSTM